MKLITDNLTNRKLEYWLLRHLVGSYYPVIITNYFLGNWECDVFSLNKSGYTAEYEIKQTKSDFLNDFKKKKRYWNTPGKMKHDIIQQGKRTNRFWFVLPEDMDVEIPDYAGRMNYRFMKHFSSTIEFQIVKQAPLLHKNKATEDQKFQMLQRLSDKHFQAVMEMTKFYDKYQLNL